MAATGVGVVELLVMVTVVVTCSPGSITPSASASKPGVATVLWMAVKVSLAILRSPIRGDEHTISGRHDGGVHHAGRRGSGVG